MASVLDRTRTAFKAAVGVFAGKVSPDMLGMLTGIAGSGNGLPPPKGAKQTLDSYSTLPWLRAVAAKIGNGVAAAEWKLYVAKRGTERATRDLTLQRAAGDQRTSMIRRKQIAGDVMEIETHPLLTLLTDANGYHTGVGLRKLTQVYLDLLGEAFWIKERGQLNQPIGLWPVPPSWVIGTPTPKNRVFRVSYSGWQVEIPDTEVLWFCDLDPANPYGRGSGTAMSLGDELDTDEYAAKYTKQFFWNNAKPDFLVFPKGGSGLSDANVRRLEEDWNQRNQGFWRAFKAHFLSKEVGVHEFGGQGDMRALQMIELRKSERDTIIQVFGVSPEMLGVVAGADRAHAEAAEFQFAKYVLTPRLEFLRNTLQERLVPEFDERLILNYESPVQEDRDFQLRASQAAPWSLNADEWREKQGLEEIEGGGGKVYMVPAQLLPTESLIDAKPEPKPTPVIVQPSSTPPISSMRGFTKYDPAQPRDPEGTPTGGQWTGDGGSRESPAATEAGGVVRGKTETGDDFAFANNADDLDLQSVRGTERNLTVVYDPQRHQAGAVAAGAGRHQQLLRAAGFDDPNEQDRFSRVNINRYGTTYQSVSVIPPWTENAREEKRFVNKTLSYLSGKGVDLELGEGVAVAWQAAGNRDGYDSDITRVDAEVLSAAGDHYGSERIHKALMDNPEDLSAINRVALRLEPRLRKQFYDAVAAAQGRINVEELAKDIASNALSHLDDTAELSSLAADWHGMTATIRAGYVAGAKVALDALSSAGVGVSFDLINPLAVTYARTLGAQAVTVIMDETRDAVRQIVADAFEQGWDAYKTARMIKDSGLGLNSPQARAWFNFGRRLQEQGVPDDQANKRLVRYAKAQLRQRSVMVARTEMIDAANAGQQGLWMEAKRQGALRYETTWRKWIVANDDRLCLEICEPMEGQEVQLDQPWTLPDGRSAMHPGKDTHPNCRCDMVLVFREPEAVGASFARELTKQKVFKKIIRDENGVPTGIEETRE